MRVCLLAVLAWTALAADTDPAARIRAAMQASLDKQKASVQKQVRSSAGFFSSPWASAWPQPVVLPAAAADCDPLPAAELDPLIEDSSKRHGLKSDLLRAVIRKESGGRPCAVSPKGALGLMQLMPGTAEDLQVADAFDPRQNLDAGARFLKNLLDRYKGNLSLALGAYNAGPAAVDKEGGVPKFAETQDYVGEILRTLSPAAAPQ